MNGYDYYDNGDEFDISICIHFVMTSTHSHLQLFTNILEHLDEYYQFFGHTYFIQHVLQEIKGTEMHTNFMKYTHTKYCKDFYRMDPNANMRNDLLIPLYSHDLTLVMRQLSLFETLLGDKENPIKKENAEEIIVAIVSSVILPNVVDADIAVCDDK